MRVGPGKFALWNDFPYMGKPVPYAIVTLKKLIKKECKIILYTMRSGKYLDEAEDYLHSNNIELYGININPKQNEWTSSPKAYAHLYIDDAAVGCPLIYGEHIKPYVDWLKIQKIILS